MLTKLFIIFILCSCTKIDFLHQVKSATPINSNLVPKVLVLNPDTLTLANIVYEDLLMNLNYKVSSIDILSFLHQGFKDYDTNFVKFEKFDCFSNKISSFKFIEREIEQNKKETKLHLTLLPKSTDVMQKLVNKYDFLILFGPFNIDYYMPASFVKKEGYALKIDASYSIIDLKTNTLIHRGWVKFRDKLNSTLYITDEESIAEAGKSFMNELLINSIFNKNFKKEKYFEY